MIFRVFDIETIPDLSCWSKGEPTYRLIPEQASLMADGPGMQLKSLKLEEVPQFPPPHAHRVVAISYVDVECDPTGDTKYRYLRSGTKCLWTRPGTELAMADSCEHEMLKGFNAAMDTNPAICLVSWNGRTFDLPVIALRALKQGVSCRWYYSGKNIRYRYTDEGHLDLMDFWSDFGACRPMKLADAAHLIGLPGKLDITGASVEAMYLSTADEKVDIVAQRAHVAKYCLQDSIQTALLFLRSRHHFGKITAAEYNQCLETFAVSTDMAAAMDGSINWTRLRLS